jgi:4-alpha-glucanotransferase
MLGYTGAAPQNCDAIISRRIIERHLDSPSMWSIFLLQDILGISDIVKRDDPFERINDPSSTDHIWDYRMHITLDELVSNKRFISDIKTLVQKGNR